MKLLLEKDDGAKIEIKEVNTLNKDCEALFFFLNCRLSKKDIESIENELMNKTGKQCIVLDALFKEKVMGI